MHLIHAIPALPVRNTTQSAAFYRDKLGFAIWHEDSGFAIVGRNTAELHLWQASDEAWNGRGGAPVQSGAESFLAGTASCRVQVDGVDELHAELAPRSVLHPHAQLADQPWGTREFGVSDPDGNLITFFERVARRPERASPESPATLYRQLLDGWNQRSAASYAAPLMEDAKLVGFDGSQLDGRAAIEAEIGRIFADHPTGQYVGKLRDLRLLTPDVALVQAVAGMIPHGQTKLNPALHSIQSLLAVRHDGRWQVALFHNTPAQFHGRPELAQQLTDELERLIG